MLLHVLRITSEKMLPCPDHDTVTGQLNRGSGRGTQIHNLVNAIAMLVLLTLLNQILRETKTEQLEKRQALCVCTKYLERKGLNIFFYTNTVHFKTESELKLYGLGLWNDMNQITASICTSQDWRNITKYPDTQQLRLTQSKAKLA